MKSFGETLRWRRRGLHGSTWRPRSGGRLHRCRRTRRRSEARRRGWSPDRLCAQGGHPRNRGSEGGRGSRRASAHRRRWRGWVHHVGANFDLMAALAAFHAHDLPGDSFVRDLILRLAAVAEKFHVSLRTTLTSLKTVARSQRLKISFFFDAIWLSPFHRTSFRLRNSSSSLPSHIVGRMLWERWLHE